MSTLDERLSPEEECGFRRIQVFCTGCDLWMDEREVEFVNIEEGMLGEDILTFNCPYCKEEQRSKRLG